MSDQNKLKQYKLTKPETFSLSFYDAFKEYQEWLINANNPQRQPRKSHKWHSNITDYFNYGFNEHTMQIYVHKITQLTETYRKYRLLYAEKCDNSKETIFNSAQEIKRQTKDVYPIDLGGIFIPVDDKVLDFSFKFQVENLYEQYNFSTQNLKPKSLNNQYHCSGEALLFKSKFISDIFRKQVKDIQDLYKQYKKEHQRDLYLFNTAVKVFPIQKEDEFSIQFAQLVKNIAIKYEKSEKSDKIDKHDRNERSRTPKKSRSKKY
ncbi:unnamed protein product [Paramecium pentaurelia]|uniref:Pre-mRNA polyadenylation factor Fip1 domain-containing protein n=1 Tax=Paramecium pentaurelia TaxID=43138 RepID=A0A8S1RWT1_9CILI|nr:unnamed protein product [Paramecium pentaurelia]